MDMGFEMDGFSSSFNISAGYSDQIMTDVQTTYSADYSIEHQLSCTAPEEGGVGFW